MQSGGKSNWALAHILLTVHFQISDCKGITWDRIHLT